MSLKADAFDRKRVMERPLVSFCLFAYNQEKFIREAVKAALAQTYAPLEIILSDDASTDGTPEIMMELARSYQGQHKIVVNREPANLGLIGHVNSVVRQARGELLVVGAGDDVSMPERVEMCYRAWADSGWRSGSVWSDYTVIDEYGNTMGQGFPRGTDQSDRLFEHLQICPHEVAAWKSPTVFGCTHAWSAEVFRRFGDLPLVKDLVIEDISVYFRSVLLTGQITRIHMPLVLYRRHHKNCSAGMPINGLDTLTGGSPSIATQERLLRRMMAVCKCFQRDLRTIGILGTQISDYRSLRREVARSYRSFQLRARLLKSGGRITLPILCRMLKLGRGRKRAIMEFVARLGTISDYWR